MPEIKIDHIVSVSSEHNKYPASNLLGPPGSGKWRSSNSGEKQVSVILQFHEPAKIDCVHIGNDSSAFVEVLVGKQSASSEQDWKVLLVASSLMTPSEARSNTNTQKVRMFNLDSLSKQASDQTWDRAKVVCTQPFNKSVPYGLSFISFLTKNDDESPGITDRKEKSIEKKTEKLGGFTLRPDSDEDTDVTSGSIFSDRIRLKASEPPPTAAAAVRAAARETDEKIGVSKTESKPKYTKNKNEDKSSSKEKEVRTVQRESATKKLPDKPKTLNKPNENNDPKRTDKQESQKKISRRDKTEQSSQPKKPSDKRSDASGSKPFKELLKGVTFSLSGFKNPKRSDLRDKAIEMGAKYSPDWNSKCTHLICAFTNTPKFAQVNGKGYILTENWILDSHKRKSKLPWRSYRLGKAKSPPATDVETDEDDSNNKNIVTTTEDSVSRHSSSAAANQPDDEPKPSTSGSTTTKQGNVYADSTDIDEDSESEAAPPSKKAREDNSWSESEESMDTDEEIAVFLAKGKSPKAKQDTPKNKTTQPNDNKSQQATDLPLPVLPNYLLNKTFFLYGTIRDRRLVYRYICAYGGEVEDYMCDNVQYVITDSNWDDNFDSALNDNPSLTFVKSKWIMDIHKAKKLLPHQKYAIVPN